MPAANPTAKQELLGDFDPWKLLETPLIYGALKTLLKINPFPGCQFDSSLALAALAQLKGEHTEALHEINRALKIEPRNPSAHLQHGAIHLSLGRHQDALLSFAQATELDPQCAIAWMWHGHTLKLLGREEGALASFEQGLRLQPDDPALLSCYGATLYALRRFEEARVALERGLALSNGQDKAVLAALHCNHGLALAQLQQHARALHSFERALALEPKLIEAWCGKAEALLELERYSEALSAAAHALSHQPGDLTALRRQGTALYYLGRYAEALEVSDALLSRDDQEADAWHSRGLALAQLERLSEAEESCRRAVELKAEEPAYWLDHGFTLNALGRYAEARDQYQQALILAPAYRLAWNNLGMTHLHLFHQAVQQHELSLAEAHWREALRNGRRGQQPDWHAEEFNFLHAAAALGHHALALQLLREAEGNLLLPPLQHALEYLLTRDLNALQTLPQELRAQTEMLVNQL